LADRVAGGKGFNERLAEVVEEADRALIRGADAEAGDRETDTL